jgi:peptidoglycan-N-acetylglucosamine deacetylase
MSAYHRLDFKELVNLFPNQIVVRSASKRAEVALTFDDGPDDHFTLQVLDKLSVAGIKATFFIVGRNAEQQSKVLRQIVKEGHIIANHSYSHDSYIRFSPQKIHNDLCHTDKVIMQITGIKTGLFRPPYGYLNSSGAQAIIREGFQIVLWDVDSQDWKGIKKKQILKNILNKVHKGSIILCHCANPQIDLSGTVKAIPEMVRIIKERGLEFVTIPDLLV